MMYAIGWGKAPDEGCTLLIEDIVGIASDHVLFVGSDDDDLDTAVCSTDDLALATIGDFVDRLVKLDAEEFQSLADLGTHSSAVLTDTSGEDEEVDATQSSSIAPTYFLMR